MTNLILNLWHDKKVNNGGGLYVMKKPGHYKFRSLKWYLSQIDFMLYCSQMTGMGQSDFFKRTLFKIIAILLTVLYFPYGVFRFFLGFFHYIKKTSEHLKSSEEWHHDIVSRDL